MRKLRIEELNRLTTEEFRKLEKTRLVIILDNLRSQNNIGSIFRTCDAFLIEKLYLCGITAIPPHRDIHKTALGSTESVSWEYAEETITVVRKLKSLGYVLLAAEQTEKSSMLQDFNAISGKKYAVVFGHEFRGVDQSVIDECDKCIEIPQFGTKHSLNVSVSAGIIIWHLYNSMHRI